MRMMSFFSGGIMAKVYVSAAWYSDLHIISKMKHQSDSVHCGPESSEGYIAGTDDAGRVKSLTVMPIKAELENVFINAVQVMFYALDFIFEFFQIDKKSEMEPFDLRFQKLMGVES